MCVLSAALSGAMKIAGRLDIYSANDITDALAECLATHPELLLDLSDVESCDIAGVQLICSAQKSAAASHKAFLLTAASPQVTRACADAGLSPASLTVNFPSQVGEAAPLRFS